MWRIPWEEAVDQLDLCDSLSGLSPKRPKGGGSKHAHPSATIVDQLRRPILWGYITLAEEQVEPFPDKPG